MYPESQECIPIRREMRVHSWRSAAPGRAGSSTEMLSVSLQPRSPWQPLRRRPDKLGRAGRRPAIVPGRTAPVVTLSAQQRYLSQAPRMTSLSGGGGPTNKHLSIPGSLGRETNKDSGGLRQLKHTIGVPILTQQRSTDKLCSHIITKPISDCDSYKPRNGQAMYTVPRTSLTSSRCTDNKMSLDRMMAL